MLLTQSYTWFVIFHNTSIFILAWIRTLLCTEFFIIYNKSTWFVNKKKSTIFNKKLYLLIDLNSFNNIWE